MMNIHHRKNQGTKYIFIKNVYKIILYNIRKYLRFRIINNCSRDSPYILV